MAQQKSIIGNRDSLIKQRRDVLPNPGTLETLAKIKEHKHVQLIKNFQRMEVVT